MHPMFDRLVALLDARSASYRVLMHDAEGKVIYVGNPNQPREDDYRVIASCASDRVYA